jgi:gluconokinase
VLREFCPTLQIVHLTGSPELLLSRMEARSDHFMPPALLWSQLTALEVPSVDETAFEANVEQSPASIAAAASVWLRRSI